MSCNSFRKPIRFYKNEIPTTNSAKERMENVAFKALALDGYDVKHMRLIDANQNTLSNARGVVRFRDMAVIDSVRVYAVVIIENRDSYEARVYKEH